jgi:Lon protease-like protein
VPLFPLPDNVLLIGVPATYRVFEPRYRALVDDLLAIEQPSNRWLAIPRLADGWQQDYYGSPAILPCAALAIARTIRPSMQGEFEIVVEGVMRCELQEIPSEQPYRRAHALPRPDEPVDEALIAQHMEDLLGHVGMLLHSLGDRGRRLAQLIDEDIAPAIVVDRLGAAILHDHRHRQSFLENRSLVSRIDDLRGVLHRALGGGPGLTPSVN